MAKNLNIAASVGTPNGTHVSKEARELTKEKIKELIAEETKIVRGTFICFETPGASTTVTVRKYPGVPVFTKTMKDGEMYEIPLYVARFLNGTDVSAAVLDTKPRENQIIGTCQYGVHGWKMEGSDDLKQGIDTGAEVLPKSGITKRVKRYGFNFEYMGGAI
jgi:hypothetical protein